jgi:hypothetical protein
VRAAEGGVRVYFSRGSDGPLFVSRKEGIFRPQEAPSQPDTDDAVLTAKIGDEFYPTNSPHDLCSVRVVVMNGQVGVQASAFFSPDGGLGKTSSQFMPAK